jgi:hypothetical protein
MVSSAPAIERDLAAVRIVGRVKWVAGWSAIHSRTDLVVSYKL